MEGYDAKFDPPLDKRLECPICLLAQREPMQTPCGHRFCSACILRALRETGPRCPVDNTRVAVHQLFKDNFARREVLSLHVYCHASEHGCPWHGELRNLQIHEKECDLVTIDCPNECGHTCQRMSLISHLPTCTNRLTPCPLCSISFPRDKVNNHSPYCSKIKLPESIMGNITKSNEVLKWCGHLKMKVQGVTHTTTGYLTAKLDAEERFLNSGLWSSNINLIPLASSAAKIFWRTLQGPEVRPSFLYFNVVSTDSRSSSFVKIIKKRYSATMGLRLKPSNRRELMILFLQWNEQEKKIKACVAELRNYLVKEMQHKLQQLERTSNSGSSSSSLEVQGPSRSRVNPFRRPSDRSGRGSGRYNGPFRVINVPPTAPPTSNNSHAHPPASHVVPSILSWQIQPNYAGAYPWRMQAAGPGVPFFTIPSTPPQFLPAHSYPYTFAPMPAIAAPPFSINHIQPVPASIAIPSGVAVPQVSGLHAEIVTSSASNAPSIHGPSNFVEGSSNSIISHVPAANVLQYPPSAPPEPHPGQSHSVNQVSVVVDPRTTGIISGPPPADLLPNVGVVNRDVAVNEHGHWVQHPMGGPQDHWNDMGPSSSATLDPPTSSTDARRLQRPGEHPDASWNLPGPSGTQLPPHSTSPPSFESSPVSFFSPVTTDNSDDDSDSYSPLHWPSDHQRPPYTPHAESSLSGATSSNGSGDETTQSSPGSQQRAVGSALQTLADAAAFLSSSPQSISSTSDPGENRPTSPSTFRPGNVIASHNATADEHRTVDSFSSSDESAASVIDLTTSPANGRQPDHLERPAPHRSGNAAPPQQYSRYPATAVPLYHQIPGGALEELPVFLPVIHPTMEQPEPEINHVAIHAPPPAPPTAPPAHSLLYSGPPPPDPGVPPLIRVSQGSQNIVAVSDPWNVVDQRNQSATFVRPVIPAPPSGGFWEEVMPSLDMRLHEGHAPVNH